MSKELKASVLAKCGELGKSLVNDVADFCKYHLYKDSRSINSPWNIWGIGYDLNVDSSIPEDADVWPLAAQILGIQEANPKLLRDQNGYYPVIGGGKLADIFNACKAQLDGPYPSTEGCIATIRRVLRWAQEGIESSNALEQGRNDE